MALLIVGLVIFFGVHLVSATPLRGVLITKLGENGYKGAYSLAALLGLVGIIWGKAIAPFVHVWIAYPQARHVTYALVLVAMILLPAAHMKGNIKRFTRHPMMWGVAFWSFGHLLVNGDLASMLLFGSFFVYSFVSMLSQNAKGASLQTTVMPIKNDLIVVAAGVTVYIAFALLHGVLFGIPLR